MHMEIPREQQFIAFNASEPHYSGTAVSLEPSFLLRRVLRPCRRGKA